jgi:hypothetical protein
MPVSSDPELADILRREQPGIEVLFISGYSPNRNQGVRRLGKRDQSIAKTFQHAGSRSTCA